MHRDNPDGSARRRAHFVSWGEVLWDIFPDRRMLGGAPANVAYHLATLGERVSLITRVGDDPRGHEARAELARHGVDIEAVQVDPARPTGWVEVFFDAPSSTSDGEPRYRLIPDCAWEHIAVGPPAERILRQAAAFCYGTLSQRTTARAFERALTLLPADCLRVCDVNLRPRNIDFAVLRSALIAADVVKLNEQEADELAELTGVSDVFAWLHNDLGVRVVALTRGSAGCRLMRGDEVADHPGFPLAARPGESADNVGAGDGFTAVLARLLVAGRPLDAVAEASNRYGAYIASRRGATPAIERSMLDALNASGGR